MAPGAAAGGVHAAATSPSALLTAATALLGGTDESQVLQAAVDQATALFGLEWISILKRSGRGDILRHWTAGPAPAPDQLTSGPDEADDSTAKPAAGSGGNVVRQALRLGTRPTSLLVARFATGARTPATEAGLSAYARLVEAVYEQARSQAALRRRVHRQVDFLNVVEAVGAAIGSVQSVDVVLDRIVQHTAAVTGVKVSSIVLIDGQGMRIAAATGMVGLETRLLEREKTATWQAMVRHGPFQVIDSQADERFPSLRAFARRAGTRACLSVPLMVRDQAIGSLDIHHPEAVLFAPEDVQLTQIVASQAAIAIENARLYTALEDDRRLLEATIQGMRDGLILEDGSGHVLYANEVAASLLGCAGRDLAGLPIAEVYARLAARAVDGTKLRARLVAAAQRRDPHAALEVCLDDHQETDLRVRIAPTARQPGEPPWHLHLWHDVRWERSVDRAKSVLLSTVSHELHTPLTNIKGFVTSLLSEDVEWDAATQRDFLREVDAETDHLSGLVDNLLDLSKLESGVLQIKRRWTDLTVVAEKVVRQLRLRVPDGTFVLDLPSDLPPLFIDPVRIGEVLRNLLENAVKYAGTGGEVRVTGACENGEVVVSVVDQGSGLPREALERMFERFYRFVPAGKQIPGTGLGLAICRGLVEAHGGRIWAESSAGMTRVSFALPLLGADQADEEEEDLLN